VLERPVVRFLSIIGKAAARQLPVAQMIADTITASPFSRTRFIAAIAIEQILLLIAFHGELLSLPKFSKA
jgi:hypothetical protein